MDWEGQKNGIDENREGIGKDRKMDENRGWIGKEDGWKMSNPTTRLNNVRNSVRSNPVNQKLLVSDLVAISLVSLFTSYRHGFYFQFLQCQFL